MKTPKEVVLVACVVAAALIFAALLPSAGNAQDASAVRRRLIPTCCIDCKDGDVECFVTCRRICLSPDKCKKFGEGVYAGYCQSVCSLSLVGSRIVPLEGCKGICAGVVQRKCAKGCKDYGCAKSKKNACLKNAPKKCG